MSTRLTRGSRIPSGRLPRTVSTAFLTSATATFGSVPISNSTKVPELPSLAVELMLRTPLSERTADSTCCVIWFSISVGAAPGCEIFTRTPGNSTSGLFTTSMRAKLSMPASSIDTNMTSGMVGFRIDQAEMLRKFMEMPRSSLLAVAARLFRHQTGSHQRAVQPAPYHQVRTLP